MNRVTLLGNLGADAELKYSPNGRPIATFRLATTEKYKKDGQTQEKTEWHFCEMWGSAAENLAQYLTKGKKILCEGNIRYSMSEKNGEKKYFTKININKLEFTGPGKEREASRTPQGKSNDPYPGPSPASNQPQYNNDNDFAPDDLPF